MMLACMDCGAESPLAATLFRCADCGGLLEVRAAWRAARVDWDQRAIGVWRYREMLPEPGAAGLVSLQEGGTGLHEAPQAAAYAGVDALWVKNEGENPTGSFKDRGMTVGVSMARAFGHRTVGCASTGNTAASLAAYAARAGLRAIVVVPAGKVALGKLAQAVVHGARVVAVRGSFDEALAAVDAVAAAGDLYLLNSVNPLRLEGQKTLAWEIVDQFEAVAAGGGLPDVIVYPVGNAGNVSAAHKALTEWLELGLIDRVPRLIGVQAQGAAPLVRLFERGGDAFAPEPHPETVATAIRIGDPVSWPKAIRAVRATNGHLIAVPDAEILAAQAVLAAREGLFVEPASAAGLAGLKRLVAAGVVKRNERVVCVTTGHGLKDAQGVLDRLALHPVEVEPEVDAVRSAIEQAEEQAPQQELTA